MPGEVAELEYGKPNISWAGVLVGEAFYRGRLLGVSYEIKTNPITLGRTAGTNIIPKIKTTMWHYVIWELFVFTVSNL